MQIRRMPYLGNWKFTPHSVQLQCDGAADGTDRRLLLFAFLRDEIEDSLRVVSSNNQATRE